MIFLLTDKTIPAVDLGKLVKVEVTHDVEVGSRWLLNKIIMKESKDADRQCVFNCGK